MAGDTEPIDQCSPEKCVKLESEVKYILDKHTADPSNSSWVP